MWIHPNNPNCLRRLARERFATKPTKPKSGGGTKSAIRFTAESEIYPLTDNVETETDQSMMLSKRVGSRKERCLKGENVLEVVDEGFAVKVIVCRGEEVPIIANVGCQPTLLGR